MINTVIAMVQRDLTSDFKDYRIAMARYMLQPAVYIFVFGYVLGGFFAAPGGRYSEVLAPGIIAITVMNSSFASVGGAIVTGYYFRSMEGWLLSPVSIRTLMMARILSGLIYGTAAGIIVTGLIWAILGIYPVDFIGLFILIMAGSLFFALLTITLFLIPERPDKGQEVFSFLLMPMTFFGCTFYSYSMLKPPLNFIALLFPTTYMSEGLRATYNPAAPHIDKGFILIGLVAGMVILFYIADKSFQRRFKDFLW